MNRNVLKVHTESPWRLENGYWIAPVIMIKEGVLCGSEGCQLWPANIIEAMAHKWHDVPVSLDHPMVNGVPVSISHSREVYARHAIGFVQDPKYDSSTKSLKATIRVPEGVRGINQIKMMREVSVGVFADNIQENGHHRGKQYVGRTVRATPDHLALLPEGVAGACSWAGMGCGVRVHNEIDELLALAGQTIANWVNDQLKGGNTMTHHEEQALYPPCVYEKSEADELEILRQWDGFNGLEPPEILELRAKHAKKQRSQEGHYEEMLLPPGVS